MFFRWNQDTGYDELLATYLSGELLVVPIFRGIDSTATPIAQKRQILLKNFRDEEFEKVVQGAKNINPKDSTTLFFLAHSYLKLKQFSEAKQTFDQLQKNGNFVSESKWYSVLIDLQTGKQEQGLSILKSYQPEEAFYTKAQKLIEALD